MCYGAHGGGVVPSVVGYYTYYNDYYYTEPYAALQGSSFTWEGGPVGSVHIIRLPSFLYKDVTHAGYR